MCMYTINKVKGDNITMYKEILLKINMVTSACDSDMQKVIRNCDFLILQMYIFHDLN
jgi:hypothetical protein